MDYRTIERNARQQAATGSTTPEQVIAAALEANPEAYGEYREIHNAGALVATLQRAGIKIKPA